MICDFWCFLYVIFLMIFFDFVCDFFVISRKVYEKKSVNCPSDPCVGGKPTGHEFWRSRPLFRELCLLLSFTAIMRIGFSCQKSKKCAIVMTQGSLRTAGHKFVRSLRHSRSLRSDGNQA